MRKSTLKIGRLQLDSPFVMAPLAGITDKAMRSLCAEQGASLTYTEMVSCKGLWYGDRKSRKLLEIGDNEGLVAFQLFGSEPEIMAHAVKELEQEKNPLIDLNAGCPVPKIVKNGDGSALLKKPQLLYDVVRAMVKSTEKPVTVKIRMGFQRGENTAVESAKAIEAAGAAAVTVHGRTREQYYEGKADWSVIEEVKKAVSIPVIGNGDVMTGRAAVDMMEETGCDGVMIARGAMGNPWVFRDASAIWRGEEAPEPPTDMEKLEMLMRHLEMVAEDKGERIAVKEIRKHVGWYVKGMHGAAAFRRMINGIDDAQQMRSAIAGLMHEDL